MSDGRTAVLIVSFGTTDQNALENSIETVEGAIKDALPEGVEVFKAFSSKMVVRILASRGTQVDSPMKALEKIVAAGFKRLLVVPTHLLAGSEYLELVDRVNQYRFDILNIMVAKPLIANVLDQRRILEAVTKATTLPAAEALVLVGHGTDHPVDAAYAALNYEARQLGLDQVFVGTVEGYPGLPETLANVKRAGYEKARLAPLLLVAGNHAKVDIAGSDPESWKSAFEREGVETRCYMKGLGEYPVIRELYAEHALEAYKDLVDAE